MKNVFKKINNKKAEMTIDLFFRIFVIVVAGALLFAALIALFSYVLKPAVTERTSTLFSEAPVATISIEA